MIEKEIGDLLRKQSLKMGVAESATGGRVSDRITNISGSSNYFEGSLVAYANEVKRKVLSVKEETLREYGAVSPQTAEEMAIGVKELMNADLGLATTGIAGPTGATPEKPVGLIYIGLASKNRVYSKRFVFRGDREENKENFTLAALKMLREELEKWGMEERKVVTCFLEYEGKIPIFRRSEKVGTYQRKWAGVSGYIEKDKTPYEQALTEIEEETGLRKEDVELLKEGIPLEIVDYELSRKWIVHPYRFQVKEPKKIRIDWEHTGMKWINPEDIAEYETVPNLKETWEKVK